MNLDELKSHIRKVKADTWQGKTVYFRKYGASDGIAMISTLKDLSSQELGEERDRNETVKYYAYAVSKSLANEQGDLELDSDEGRTLLAQMYFTDLCELGALALRHGGFVGEKKSTPSPTCSLSDSASHSEESTPIPTTCTLS